MSIQKELDGRLIIAEENEAIVSRRAALVSRVWVVIIAFGFLILFQFGGLLVLFKQVQDLESASGALQSTVEQVKSDLLVNRENGYRTRAINCQILVSLGEELPATCLEAPVVELYDPGSPPKIGAHSEGQQINRDLLCGLYEGLDLREPTVCHGETTSP